MNIADPTSMAMVAATNSVGVFGSLMPKLGDVRQATQKDLDIHNDVHMGQLTCGGIVIGIGLIASVLSKSPVPAMVAIVAAVVMAVIYEGILKTPPKEKVA